MAAAYVSRVESPVAELGGAVPAGVALLPHIAKSGQLKKKNSSFPYNYAERFFTLHVLPQKLIYLSQQSADVQEAVEIKLDAHCSVQPVLNDDEAFVLATPERSFHLRAASEAERDAWVEALQRVLRVDDVRAAASALVVDEAVRDAHVVAALANKPFEGEPFLKPADAANADDTLATLRVSVQAFTDKLSEEERDLLSVVVADYEALVGRVEGVVQRLHTRLRAHEHIARFRAEELATNIALRKGEHEIERARAYWEGAKRILADIEAEAKGADTETEDAVLFLDALADEDTVRALDMRIRQMAQRRRPSIIKASTGAVDRAVYNVRQLLKSYAVKPSGKPVLTPAKVDQVTKRFDELEKAFQQFEDTYDSDENMKEQVATYREELAAVRADVQKLQIRLSVHELIRQVDEMSKKAALAVACRRKEEAERDWAAVQRVVEDLKGMVEDVEDASMFVQQHQTRAEKFEEKLKQLE